MGVTLYLFITPSAEMSRKFLYLRAKLVVADCCLVSINVATEVNLVYIRFLPFST